RWQAEEQKVQQDFRKGRGKVSKSAKEFLDDLDAAIIGPALTRLSTKGRLNSQFKKDGMS
ncbi:MAG: hypothetical protein AABY77_07065, partial [Nitrospirota bacterium]